MPKKVNPTLILTKAKVMKAEITQLLNKDKSNVDSSFKLMKNAVARKDSEKLRSLAATIVKSRKRIVGFERINDALFNVSQNSNDISNLAQKDKNIAPQFLDDMTILSNVGPGVKLSSFTQFYKEVICSLYPKTAIQQISGQDKLSPEMNAAFFSDAITNDELMNVYIEFSHDIPDQQERLEETLGFKLAPPATIPPPDFQTPTSFGAPPSSIPGSMPNYPQFPPTGMMPNPSQSNGLIYVPVDIPEFTRDRWPGLSRAIFESFQ